MECELDVLSVIWNVIWDVLFVIWNVNWDVLFVIYDGSTKVTFSNQRLWIEKRSYNIKVRLRRKRLYELVYVHIYVGYRLPLHMYNPSCQNKAKQTMATYMTVPIRCSTSPMPFELAGYHN